MPRKKPEPRHNGLFTIYGLSINLNVIITTIAASISWLLISATLSTVRENVGYVREIPQIKQDVQVVKDEQTRIRKEYAPPVK